MLKITGVLMAHVQRDLITADIEHTLVGDIYDAALNPLLWPTIMKTVAEQCDARIANIVISDTLNPDYQIIHGLRATEAQLNLLKATDRTNFEVAKKLLKHGAQIGVATACHNLFPNRESFCQAMGDEYISFLEKADVQYQMGSIIELTDFRYSIISVCRGKNSQPFPNELIEFIGRLTPHIRRSLQIFRQLSFVRHENTHLYAMLDELNTGVLLLDASGKPRYANATAEKHLIHHQSLDLTMRHGLKSTHHNQWQRLQTLIDGAINTGAREQVNAHRQARESMPSGGVINIQDSVSGKNLILTITPISGLSGYRELANDGISAAIFVTDPLSKRTLNRRLLKQAYALSEREFDVCEMFLNCMSIDVTAELLSLSISTVRGYLKEIYVKTDRHSQAELMGLLMGFTIDFEHIH
jgi:DNA-binding CsgD family transcriptional regulator